MMSNYPPLTNPLGHTKKPQAGLYLQHGQPRDQGLFSLDDPLWMDTTRPISLKVFLDLCCLESQKVADENL